MRQITPPGSEHDEREIEAVVDVLKNSRLQIGPKVEEFESKVAALMSKKYGVMVNSGTSAIYLALDLLDLEPGDEIVTSVLTFSADIAPIVRGGWVPAFVDVEPSSYQIDVNRIEEMIGPRTKAIMTPNLVGNCPDWDAIREIADRHGLCVIEDTCDVLGEVTLRGTRTGTRADIGVTSFAVTHSITAAGAGGMVGLDDPALLDRCLVKRRWGRRSETYLFGSNRGKPDRFSATVDGLAYDNIFVFEDARVFNFEPSELGAAFGLVQLEKLDEFNRRRRDCFARYDEWFLERDDLFIRPTTTPGVETTWMLYPFMLRPERRRSRTECQEFLEKRGVPTRVVWSGNITRQPGFSAIERREPDDGFPNADRVMEYALMLPAHQGMNEDDLDYVIEVLDEFADQA
ncbi:MAG: DegT/DnrJ/EryC1/StrS family aminotransferase [Proteobacteria bacterium]|nr:DegT/DnrJ/EryC1/StrS family aminotransferase [Pseudomonadota bacterium]